MHTKRKPIPVIKAQDLTPEDLAYYREMWGFDPVKELKIDPTGYQSYEIRLQLEHDPALHDAGVQMIAWVEEDNGDYHNRLGFERGDNQQLIECIHTAIYEATPEELANFSTEDFEKHLGTTEGRPAILPPWEHFVSLKSFAAGLVDRGILTTLFTPPAESFSEGINEQLVDALYEVAPEIVKDLVAERVGDIIERAPEDWIKSHAEALYLRYKVNLLFYDPAYLASVDNSTRKKLLLLFLTFLHGYLADGVYDAAGNFLCSLCEGNFLDGLDLDTTKTVIRILFGEYLRAANSDKIKNALLKTFYNFLEREDARLCNPDILERLLFADNESYDEEGEFVDFDNSLTDDFLRKMFDAVFQIWEKGESFHLGDFPYFLMVHFLQRGDNQELLKEFIRLAPSEWLAMYYPLLDERFNLQCEMAKDQALRNKINTLNDYEHIEDDFTDDEEL